MACAPFAAALLGISGPAQAADQLPASIQASKTITYCASVTLPPYEFYDAKQQPQGVDVEIGTLLAKRLGLTAKWANTPFAGLIPALVAGHCDAIISGLFIKPARLKVIDEIPYMYSWETVLLKAGAPKLDSIAGLSGKKVATVTGTSATVLLQAENTDLEKAGKAPVHIIEFPENAPALQQLQFGQVDAYGIAYEAGTYYSNLNPGQFELGVPPYYKILVGIGVPKGEPGLENALKGALADIMKDGSYAAVFKKWNLELDMLSSKP